jgi:hypothetical protein
MKWQTGALAVLALAVLAGCPQRTPAPKQAELWVRVVEDAAGNKKVEIDRSEEHHDSVVVEPGDRITWACLDASAPETEPRPCPADVEFAIDELHYVGDLEQLVETLRRPVTFDPEQLAAVSQELQALQQQAVTAPPAQPEGGEKRAAENLMRGRIHFEGPVGPMIRVVRDGDTLAAAPAGGPSRALFEDEPMPSVRYLETDEQLVPLKFQSGDELIRSGRVAGGIGDSVWKFTWRVRLKGVPASEDTLDPHIYGHDDIDG